MPTLLRFATVFLYVFSPTVRYTNNAVLTDTLAQCFIFLSLFFYVKKDWPASRFLAGGLCVALAFFTKFLLAAIAPLLAMGYLFFYDRISLKHPMFLLSLLAIPFSIGLHYSVINNPQNFSMLYATDMIGNFTKNGFDLFTRIRDLTESAYSLFLLESAWVFLSLMGVWKYGRQHPFFAFWYALLVFPLVTAGLRPWYFLPVIPPIAYFSVLALVDPGRGRFRIDHFTIFGFLVFLLSGTVIASITFGSFTMGYGEQKRVGEFIAGQPNVLVAGDYGIEVIAYKVLTERHRLNESLDFGWLFLPKPFNDSVRRYVDDYHRADPRINEDNINHLYWRNEIFRKKTDLIQFGYVVVLGNHTPTEGLAGDWIYNSSTTQVIKLKNHASN